MPTILAVESSCDETAIAIYDSSAGVVLANKIYSQIDLHRKHGGVVPELAARDHIKQLPILLKTALHEAQLPLKVIDYFAYTSGPGLLGALMTGASFCHSIAFACNKPIIPVHHMEGHLLSSFLTDNQPEYPFIALLVSGGHSQLMAVTKPGQYRLLGETLDDAVGEAFDKTAKLMGLPYPGGPELAALAKYGDKNKFNLSRPMVNRPGMDMSFSGLKTQVRLLIEREGQSAYADIAACFEATVADTLAIKCQRAWRDTGYRDLVVGGGVSANTKIREALYEMATKLGKKVYFPERNLCGDNALMIAYAAAQRIAQAQKEDHVIDVKARWSLDEIAPVEP